MQVIIFAIEGTVRQWCRTLKDVPVNVHDKEKSDRTSAVSDDLIESVYQKIVKDGDSQLHNCLVTFQKIPRIVLYENIIANLGYHNSRAGLVPKMLRGAYKRQRMASALAFSRLILQKKWQ
jgi:hypothetical protein